MPSPFVWHELLTTDPVAASIFYSQLFGWEVVDGGFAINGARVAGVRASTIHAHWAPFVRVPDPEGSALAAVAAGGSIAGSSSSPVGIVLLDRGVPTVVTTSRGRLLGDGGLFAWHIRESRDVAAAAAWLGATVGWTSPGRGGLWVDGAQVASLMTGEHDRWLGHVLVKDRRSVRATAVGLGATVEQADVDAWGHGSFDVLLDLQGAEFCLFEAAGSTAGAGG